MNIKKKEKRKSCQKEKGFPDRFNFISLSSLPGRIARLLQAKRATLFPVMGVLRLTRIKKASRKTVAASGNSYSMLGITTDRLSKGSVMEFIGLPDPSISQLYSVVNIVKCST